MRAAQMYERAFHKFQVGLSLSMGALAIFVLICASAPLASAQRGGDSDYADDEDAKYIHLTIGLEETIDLPKLPKRISMKGDYARIVTATRTDDLKSLKLVPKREGFRSLTIHDKRTGKMLVKYRIEVKKSQLDKVVRELQSLLGDIEGISIKVMNARVVIDGQVLLPKDLRRIGGVVKQYGDQVVSLVAMSPLAMKKIAEFISRDINNPEIEVRTVNDWIVLEGYANSEAESQKAESIAKLYMPEIVNYVAPNDEQLTATVANRKPAGVPVLNNLLIKEGPAAPPPKLIQIVVHFVELAKDYQKAFNFEFVPRLDDGSGISFGNQGAQSSATTSIVGTITNLLPKLNWAKTHGHARVLESTSLIVQDGRQGTIAQNTKQPYPIIGPDNTQGTGFADVGLTANVTPKISADKSGTVSMDLNFELSNLTGFSSRSEPIVAKNSVVTSVSVRDRQSAAIGGLIKNSTTTDYNRPPEGLQNAILSIYASKKFQRAQTQFVVFVTPIIKTSASTGSEQIKKKFRMRE